MTTEYLDKRLSILPDDPQNVQLIHCSACQIHTNHHRTPNNEWVCWCGNVDEPGHTVAERQAMIDYEIAHGRAEWTDGLWEEIAENIVHLEGSDTSWNQQLLDAGFGPGGIL